MKTTETKNVNLKDIEIVSNTRKYFNTEELTELKNSIIEKGILQPIGILKTKGNFRLIFGERRYKACLEIQLKNKKYNSIPCLIFENLTESEILELQITENLQRKDINPVEEAEAFKDLLNNKVSIKDIGLKVGKSISFVVQRLKLNNLSDEFKQALLLNRITISEALSISILSIESQKIYWIDEFEDINEKDELNIYPNDFNNYLNNLSKSSFDIKDKNLIPNTGACTSCQFNTSCNLLFPEESTKSVCTNTVCFTKKSNVSFDAELTKALENPSIDLLFVDYGKPNEKTKTIIENGNLVLLREQFELLDKPKEPNLSDYKENLADGNYDDEDEMMNEFNDDLDSFNKEVAHIKNLLDSGKVRKGFVVEGNNKGNYLDFVFRDEIKANIKFTSKDLIEKLKSETVSVNDFDNEINRLLVSEVRKKELDEEKAQPLFFEVLKNDVLFNELDSELIKEEKIAMTFVLLETVGYYGRKTFNFIDYKFLINSEITEIDKIIAKLSRAVLINKLQPQNQDRPSKSDTAKILIDILEQYRPTEKLEILSNIEIERNTRAEKLNQKILDLEVKKSKLITIKDVA